MAHDPTPFPAVQPLDAHNRRLLENVHPPAWTNPQPKGSYHLVVIGAGTAGLVTAAIGAALGARVALVERELMGGDCLNVGCVPSKAVLAAARGWQAAREAAERFGGPAVSGDGDFAAVMERMRRIRADISPVDSAARFRDELGVDVFLGAGPLRTRRGRGGGGRARGCASIAPSSPRARAPPSRRSRGSAASRVLPTRPSSRSRSGRSTWPSSAAGRSGASWRRRSRASARG